MTAPQVPLEQNQDPNPLLENQNNPNPDPNSQNPLLNPSTEPKVVPKVFSEDDLKRTHELYGSALQEAESKRKQLEKDLEEARATRQNPILDDSQLTPEQLIRREVQASVKPLIDEFSAFRQQSQQNTYQTLKNQFRLQPQIAPYFTQLEPYIDQEMQGKEPTTQNLHNAVAKVVGLFMLQQPVQQNNPQNPQQQQNQNPNPRDTSMLPPHLRPSNPPAPNRQNGGKIYRQLTELEKRVAREQGKTEHEYLDWLDVPPDQVIHSRIGLPELK